jgi:hypothetical protein
MPPPQNITPVEWAIAKIKDTLRKRKGPGWSEQDFSEFQIAWHVVSDKNETVRVRLARRFADAGDRLLWRITSKNDQAEWESFGRRIANILGTFPNAFPIGGASRLIYRMVGGGETGWWGRKRNGSARQRRGSCWISQPRDPLPHPGRVSRKLAGSRIIFAPPKSQSWCH